METKELKTREKILLATLELASENGLGAVSLSMIAKRVGVQKATLYSHFASKDEIIDNLYVFLRERAKQRAGIETVDYGEFVKGKKPDEVLTMAVKSYQNMNASGEMAMFYKFILSERVFQKEAAKVMVMETEKMILATKQMFYAMQIHGIIKFQDIDLAAFSFAMAIHSIINYECDKKMAEEESIMEKTEAYIKHFCEVYQNADKQKKEN